MSDIIHLLIHSNTLNFFIVLAILVLIVIKLDLKEKTIIHTTSAGTQGIANAINAEEILTGSLVNAKAIAEYIKRNNCYRN